VRRLNRILGTTAVAVASAVVVAGVARPAAWLEHGRTAADAARVASAAAPEGLVLADEEHADWLLWQEPSLAGRIAYDVRFELFDVRDMVDIRSLLEGSRQVWARCGVNARVVTFENETTLGLARQQGVLGRGARVIAHDAPFTAVVQPVAGRPCRHP
jgi:hypothetical protein